MLYYRVLPTDPRLAALSDWQCDLQVRMLELDAIRRQREADNLPAKSFEDLTGDVRFEQGEAELDKRWAREAADRAAGLLQRQVGDGDERE